jgi:hypothetical protein
MYKWNSRKFTARLTGNFLISFGSPFVGVQVFLNADFAESLFISVFSSSIVMILVAGRELLQYADSKTS